MRDSNVRCFLYYVLYFGSGYETASHWVGKKIALNVEINQKSSFVESNRSSVRL